MSRLIIKNLPSYVTPERLKDHFLEKGGPGGTLTDVKVAQKPDGTSRRFGFVGFKTEDEAQKAQKWFDRTFIGMTRINVQVVEKGAKDAPVPRPNKKLRLESSSSEGRSQPTSDRKSKKEKQKKFTEDVSQPAATTGKARNKKEADLEEFMKVMQPRTKKERTWANEDALAPAVGPSSRSGDALADEAQTGRAEEAGVEEGTVEEVDDLEWMRRRMKRSLDADLEEKGFIQDEDEKETPSQVAASTSKAEPLKLPETQGSGPSPSDAILQTGRLFLRNLTYACTQSDLEAHFSQFGTISQVHIPLDPVTKESKGLAFVRFSDLACAVRAYEELDKTPFQGRLLHILPAAEQKGTGVKGVEEGTGKSTVKKEKEKKRKESATKEFNWSMLYTNADAVASSIADRMNITKADILNPDAETADNTSAAVKLALAETHIVQETKAFLESEGIDLSAFSSLDSTDRAVRARRLDTVILVKNIPYGTTAEQIRALFEPHGELSRVLVPPSGTIAVVEFVHPDEAAKGFRAVAYRRMGSSIIYLEKAPMGIFGKASSPEKKIVGGTLPVVKPVENEEAGERDEAEGESEEAPPGSTLFVKNLAFATTSERLTSVVRHLPGFAFARIQTKPDPKRPAIPGQPPPRLSMGFGFVGFKSPDAAKTALKSLQGLVLDGHTLTVKFAGRGTEDDFSSFTKSTKGEQQGKAKTTKMVVKNVPFEATKSDLRSLFGAHGQLKSVRLPKKFDSRSSARGFAFLDFAMRHEAERAFSALRHTHLLGRHLVLEWAADGAVDVDKLRQKAGVGYGDGSELPGRKRKLEFGEKDDVEEE